MNKQAWTLAVMAIVLALCLAACSSDRPSTGPTTTETPAEAVTEETVPAVIEDVATTLEEPTAAEEEPIIPPPASAFSSAAVALEKLDSYRYTTLFLFVGEQDGEPESGSIELTGVVAGLDEKHLVWRNLDENDLFEVVQIGDEAWILADGEWEAVPLLAAEAMSQAALVYAPAVAWGGLFGELEPTATYVGLEVLNGIPSHHYTATYEQWGGYWEGELVGATGDVWIAEAGYPIKYDFSATGIHSDGDRGTVTWTMELSDVNAEITIEAPL